MFREQNMHHITALPAFKDNYIWCMQFHGTQHVLVVDPGDPEIVQAHLLKHNLQLFAILITHHHWDHVDGLPQLQQQWPDATLYLPAAEQFKIKHSPTNCHYVSDGDVIKLKQPCLDFEVISTPGHTLGHVCYVTKYREQTWLFCGDTLFSGGCGRLFEGTPAQMLDSLKKLNLLPADTQIFCTHEYTVSNLKFAREVEPDNHATVEHLALCEKLRGLGTITLPSTLQLERSINPFLRCEQPAIQHRWRQNDEQNLFTFLREWKNRF